MDNQIEETKSCWNCANVYCDDHCSDCDKHRSFSNLKNFPFNKTKCKDWEPNNIHVLVNGKVYLSEDKASEQLQKEYLNNCL